MSDLVERPLDDGGSNDRYSKGYYDGHCAAREDAVDEIARLTANVEGMRAVVDEVRDLPWVLKHAAGAYIDAGWPEHHQPTLDRANRLLDKLRALDGEQ